MSITTNRMEVNMTKKKIKVRTNVKAGLSF